MYMYVYNVYNVYNVYKFYLNTYNPDSISNIVFKHICIYTYNVYNVHIYIEREI